MHILGLFGHFHTEVNPEVIPNLSQRAAESLKIENLNLNLIIYLFQKIENLIKKFNYYFQKIENKMFLKFEHSIFRLSRPAESAETLESRQPAEIGWFISGLNFVHN
jgi:hypothetical protein